MFVRNSFCSTRLLTTTNLLRLKDLRTGEYRNIYKLKPMAQVLEQILRFLFLMFRFWKIFCKTESLLSFLTQESLFQKRFAFSLC